LRRFGVPQKFLGIISAIYMDRRFIVRDAGSTSAFHAQHYGICQGCPLSPFLFSMLMTILMHDAKSKLADRGVQLSEDCLVNDLLYADDTLIIDSNSVPAEQFMRCIGETGSQYGLTFNWRKLEAMPVRCDAHISKPDGTLVKQSQHMVYLGSILCSNGGIGSELGRRIGAAQAEFNKLSKIWSHSVISRARKVQIYEACVLSKLMYTLHAAWLSVAERRRLDAFQARCLRKIFGVKHSMISRVSNAAVLTQAQSRPLSSLLLERQLLLLGDLAIRPDSDILRRSVFLDSRLQLRGPRGPRGRGRPRTIWARAIFQEAITAAGSLEALSDVLIDTPAAKSAWQALVRQHCTN
jgi:hypothetical protein